MKSSTAPRPILKRSPSPCRETDSELPFYGIQAVHFPPSPSMSRFYKAHSPTIYDRSPIEVSTNSCALPERGCPGRTYTLEERSLPTSAGQLVLRPAPRGGHLHPRALQRLPQSSQNIPHCPPLIPDLSSESEESDGFISPPSDDSYAPYGYPNRSDKFPSISLDHASYFSSKWDGIPRSTESRRIPRREKQQYSPVAGDVAADDPGYDDDRDIAFPASRCPKKDRCRKSSSTRAKVAFNDAEDVGCLGGF